MQSGSKWVLRLSRERPLISVIPAEDYNPCDKSLLVMQRPSAVAVNQLGLLNYSFSVYSRRQVHDLCDDSPGRCGEVVTRKGGVGEIAMMMRRRRRGNLSDSGAR